MYNSSLSVLTVPSVPSVGSHSTRLLAATTLRNVLGTKSLADMLAEREAISHLMQSTLDEATDPWGVKVERVEIKDVRLPLQLQRAMAAEAEATREARAKIIAAEGEHQSSRALREAADVISESSSALQVSRGPPLRPGNGSFISTPSLCGRGREGRKLRESKLSTTLTSCQGRAIISTGNFSCIFF